MLFASIALLLFAGWVMAEKIHVAVASNFTGAIETLSERFEAKTGHTVTLIFGSTGKHYAQIENGAPFDVFLAADVRRPQRMEQDGIALPGTRFTYAVGKVVLWSPRVGYVDPKANVLERGGFRHLAIANPTLAPYGKAAQEVLQARGVWDELSGRIVRGENIGQALQFIRSGNAELGFVAWSQVKRPGRSVEGSWWEIPQTLYSPIEQQAVLLKDSKAARAFLLYIRSDEARDVIRGYGYGTP